MTVDAIHSADPYRRGQGHSPVAQEETFTFSDALDVVNPLQHIPLVGWLYREVTGDTIKAPASIAGGALFGGPLGFAGAVLAAAFESLSGETPESSVARLLDPSTQAVAATAYRRAAGLADG